MSKRRCMSCHGIKFTVEFAKSKTVCNTCIDLDICATCGKHSLKSLLDKNKMCRKCSKAPKITTRVVHNVPVEFEQPTEKVIQINIPKYNKEKVPVAEYANIHNQSGGLYFFYDEDYKLIYLGRAEFLKSRITQHLSGKSNTKDIYHNFKYLSYMVISNPIERDMLEIYLINELKPLLNVGNVYYEVKESRAKYYKDGPNEIIGLGIDINL